MNKFKADELEELLDGRKLYAIDCESEQEFKDGTQYVFAHTRLKAEDILRREIAFWESNNDVDILGVEEFDPITDIIDPNWDDHAIIWHDDDFDVDIDIKMYKQYQQYKIDQYSLEKEIIEKQFKLDLK